MITIGYRTNLEPVIEGKYCSQLPNSILFDMDDTIVDTYNASRTAWKEAAKLVSNKLGLDEIRVFDAFLISDSWYWKDANRADWGRLNQASARELISRHAFQQLDFDDEEMSKFIGEFVVKHRIQVLKPFTGALETLSELHRRGIALALVTNGEKISQRGKIDRVGLSSFFDSITVEGEFGVGKPSREIFERALNTIKSRPGDSWMVGDDLAKDIAGASACGMFTVWVDSRRKGLPPESVPTPNRIVQTIVELLE